MVSAALSVLGPALSTAAESYLRSISPQADLEREEIRAKRQLLPLEVEAQQLAIQQARREATQPRIQALGNGQYAILYADRPPEIRTLGAGGETYAPLGSSHVKVTDATGHQRIEELPSADPLKQMQAEGWKMLRQKYPQGLTPEALKDPFVQDIIDKLIKGRSDIVVVPQVGPFKREDLQKGTAAGPAVPQASSAASGMAPASPNVAPRPRPGGTGRASALPDTATTEEIAAQMEQMPPEDAYTMIANFPNRAPAQQKRLVDVFTRVYGAPPTEAYRARWKTPVAAIQKTSPVPPGGLQPLVVSPEAVRKSEQDYQHNVRDVQKLNVDIERLNLAEKNATNAEERARIRAERARVHEERQLALHIETQTKNERDSLQAIERSEAVTKMLMPLVTPYTVGKVGQAKTFFQNVVGQFPPIAEQQLERVRLQALAEANAGTLGDTPDANRYWGHFLTRYDPRMDKIAFYTGILAYAHARAQKGGGQLRVSDIERADKLIQRASTAAGFMTLLQENQRFLAGEKHRLQRAIAEKTKRLQATGAPGAAPAEAPDPLEDELKD